MSADKIYGLVLAGGKSSRMGKDKGSIRYHNTPQRDYTYKMLEAVCEQTFMSIREEQKEEINSTYNIITDINKYKGPYNGIMSAYAMYPNVAWLILATDLPLLGVSDLIKLIKGRNRSKLATAFATTTTKLPEPLVAIWEPRGLKKSEKYLNSNQGTCPRKFLIHNDIQLVFPDDDQVLMNANTIDELNKARQKIQSS